jgi:hypothetical protein
VRLLDLIGRSEIASPGARVKRALIDVSSALKSVSDFTDLIIRSRARAPRN